MNKKQLYSIIVSIVIIGVIFVFWKVTVPKFQLPNQIKENNASNQIDKPSNKSDISSKNKSGSTFYGSSEYASFFEDVPCKESYLIFNYLANLINENQKKSETLAEIAAKLAEAGLFDKALQIANLIDVDIVGKIARENPSKKEVIIEGDDESNKILTKLREKGDKEAEWKILDDLLYGGKDQKNEALQKVSDELAKAGEIDKALKVASNIAKANSKYNFAMEHIFDYLAENGEYDRVLNIAESIGKDENSNSEVIKDMSQYIKSEAVRKNISFLIKRGDYDEALRQANSTADWHTKVEILTDIAKGLMKADHRDRGKEVFQSAIDILNSDVGSDNEISSVMKSEYFETIASELAYAGEMDWSKKIFEQTLNTMRSFDEENYWYSPKTAKAILTSGHFEWGIAEAYNYKDNSMTRSIFVDSAKALSKLDKNEYADILFKKGIEIWEEEIQDSPQESKDLSHRWLSSELAYSGRFDWALNVANTIVSKEKKDDALSVIADSLAENNQVQKALSIIDTIDSDKVKFDTLKNILTSLIKNKNYEWYDKILSKMLDYANSQKDPKARNETFLIISKLSLDLPCSEQQKYIQKFVSAYDSGAIK